MSRNEQGKENRSRSAHILKPYQLMNRLWKKYEHLSPEERNLVIGEEIKKSDLPDDEKERLLRDHC